MSLNRANQNWPEEEPSTNNLCPQCAKSGCCTCQSDWSNSINKVVAQAYSEQSHLKPAISDAITSLQWAALCLDIPAERECQFNDSIRGLQSLLKEEGD